MKDLFALLLQVSSAASKCGADLEDCLNHWKPVLTLATEVSGKSISQLVSKMMIDSLTNMIELECDDGYSSLWEHCSNYARSHSAGSLDKLDDNSLSHVFTFLPERDIKAMELVCHRTLQISRSMHKPFKNKSLRWDWKTIRRLKGRGLRQFRRSQVTDFTVILNNCEPLAGHLDLNVVLPYFRNDVRSVVFKASDVFKITDLPFNFVFPNVTEVSIHGSFSTTSYESFCQLYHDCISFEADFSAGPQNPEMITCLIIALQGMTKLNNLILCGISACPMIDRVESLPKMRNITDFEVVIEPDCIAGLHPFFHDRLETLDITLTEPANVNEIEPISIPNLRNLGLDVFNPTDRWVHQFIVSQFQLPAHLETIDLSFCSLPAIASWMTHSVDELIVETGDEIMFGWLAPDMVHQMINDAMNDCKVKNFKLKFAIGNDEDFMNESNRVVLIMQSMVMNIKHSSFIFDIECRGNFYQQNVDNFTQLESFDNCTLNIKIL